MTSTQRLMASLLPNPDARIAALLTDDTAPYTPQHNVAHQATHLYTKRMGLACTPYIVTGGTRVSVEGIA